MNIFQAIKKEFLINLNHLIVAFGLFFGSIYVLIRSLFCFIVLILGCSALVLPCFILYITNKTSKKNK